MWRLRNLGRKQSAQKLKDELDEYRRNPDAANNPVGYFNANEQSKFLLSIVRPRLDVNASIKELGYNV